MNVTGSIRCDLAAVGNARCDEISTACRNKAAFIELYGIDNVELDEIVTAIEEAA